MQPLTFVFFGRSGSGKGTQAKLLMKFLREKTPRKVLYLETGQMLRDFMDRDTLSSRLTREVLEHGGLMPEFLPIWLWTGFLVQNFSGEEHLILDGASRRIHEAPILHDALKFYHVSKSFVVYLNVPRERAFAMLKGRGRKDDTDEHINKRLDWFDKNVLPVVDYFRTADRATLLEIDGTQSIEKVHEDILRAANLRQ
ncbi:MAG: nucleoside monophosphate kinase [Patescibacteria group bacterium]